MITVEALYEDHVLKPLVELQGVHDHESVWVMIRAKPKKSTLRRLIGSLNAQEACEMRAIVDGEFERVEGQW